MAGSSRAALPANPLLFSLCQGIAMNVLKIAQIAAIAAIAAASLTACQPRDEGSTPPGGANSSGTGSMGSPGMAASGASQP